MNKRKKSRSSKVRRGDYQHRQVRVCVGGGEKSSATGVRYTTLVAPSEHLEIRPALFWNNRKVPSIPAAPTPIPAAPTPANGTNMCE
jgi:hypothetical protein